jgi:hypothetical protein
MAATKTMPLPFASLFILKGSHRHQRSHSKAKLQLELFQEPLIQPRLAEMQRRRSPVFTCLDERTEPLHHEHGKLSHQSLPVHLSASQVVLSSRLTKSMARRQGNSMQTTEWD